MWRTVYESPSKIAVYPVWVANAHDGAEFLEYGFWINGWFMINAHSLPPNWIVIAWYEVPPYQEER